MIFLNDLQIAHRVLVPEAASFAATTVLEGVSYNEREATVLMMYLMTVLAEVCTLFITNCSFLFFYKFMQEFLIWYTAFYIMYQYTLFQCLPLVCRWQIQGTPLSPCGHLILPLLICWQHTSLHPALTWLCITLR